MTSPRLPLLLKVFGIGRILLHYLSQRITGRIMTLMAWKPTVMRINVLSTVQKAFGLSQCRLVWWFTVEFRTLSDMMYRYMVLLISLHTHEGMLGVVEYRDGFIEVRDSNWNTIGRFADVANAEGFATFINDTV